MMFSFIIMVYLLLLCFNIPYMFIILIINSIMMLLYISYNYINYIERNNNIGYNSFKVKY